MKSTYGSKFDVLLRSSEDGNRDYQVGAFKVSPIIRTIVPSDTSRIEFNKRRVGSKGDEKAGLTEEQIQLVKKEYAGKNLPDKCYRAVEGRTPLFIVYFVRITHNGKPKVVPAYGVSFPGDPGSGRRPQNLVEYVVNTTWWNRNYNLADEEDED